MGTLSGVLWALTSLVSDEAAPIVNILAAVASLGDTFGSEISNVQADYSGLEAALAIQFNLVLGLNGSTETAAITDWGKAQQINALITGGQLVWPLDDTAALAAANQAYELGLYQSMMPVAWQAFAGFQYNSNTLNPGQSACSCVAMLQGLQWGDEMDPSYNPNMDYRCYWIGEMNPNGNPNAACQRLFAPPSQGGMGIPIIDALLNLGNWSFIRQLAEYTPSCVSK